MTRRPVILLSQNAESAAAGFLARWLSAGGAEVLDGSVLRGPALEAASHQADALVLAGGEDLDPALYGRAGDIGRCFPPDAARDAREWRLLQTAFGRGLPVLGVCRGHQVLNVFLGGTLIVDLTADAPSSTAHQIAEGYGVHDVTLEPGSRLNPGSSPVVGSVNTWHHQAVDRPGRGLRVVARAPDGVIEATEGSPGAGFLLGVQWHPENMSGPYADLPLQLFLEAARTVRA